ncbi:MAG: 4-(cytidine 5'-diphospho)-2-C-methyl-D-erythritol kinase [Lachnospiraceae bacterium]|nr:4-(cytidine 5'-diphospho)-2-C-methyl-D-erythritol kinase [Lachnospiraceae bacterium]
MKSTTEYAYAKINLALDVVGVRDNGYHDVRMIMQSVDLHDTLKLTKTETPGITLDVGMTTLPAGPGNLVYDAAKMLFDEYSITGGVRIELDKRIPMSAGLAGGSSDAAATLRGMNRLFELGISETLLRQLGVRLGADIPYCISGGTALAEGIGEIISPLPSMPKCHLLLVKPPAGVSTSFVYRNLNMETLEHPDVDGMIEAIKNGSYIGIVSKLGNVLESVTLAHCPEIAAIKTQMQSLGADGVLMSGSGPTVYGVFPTKAAASFAYTHFRVGPYGSETYLAQPLDP